MGRKPRLASVLLAVCLLLGMLPALLACKATSNGEVKYLVGVSLANMREPWRLVLMRELEAEAEKYPEIRLIYTDATQDSDKQINDIERLLGYGIDLLIISPCDVERLTPVVSDTYNQIPVIVLDRAVEGYDYSLFIGPDNELIGQQAATAVMQLAAERDKCRVLELRGRASSQASEERSLGFSRRLKDMSCFSVVSLVVDDESRDATQDLLLERADLLEDVDVLFAHNDFMALGASLALQQLGRPDIPIIGIDGFAEDDGGLTMIRNQQIYGTITCPTGGREAVQYALDILNRESGVPKQVILRSGSVTLENLDEHIAAMERPASEEGVIRVGYAQVGTESGWRLANNDSISTAAREFGIDLWTIDADNSVEAQHAAVREFIAGGVDIIVLSPIVDNGWQQTLAEAKDAGIPVLLSDRKIDAEEEDMYMTFIGADFIEEGRRAMRWVRQNVAPGTKDAPVRILEIRGTEGATPTIERKAGFEQALATEQGYTIVHSADGDFTIEEGRSAVEGYIAANEGNFDIDVIFAHNDDMAIGAVQALEGHGILPGVNVKIVSVDGIKDALSLVQKGKINCVVECSPLLGPQLMKAIKDYMGGKELPLRIITDEIVFTADNVDDELPHRKY